MASVYRPKNKDGTFRSPMYYSRIVIDGKPVRIPLSEDKNQAKAMLGDLIRKQKVAKSAPKLAGQPRLHDDSVSFDEFEHMAILKRSPDQEKPTQDAERRALKLMRTTIPVQRLSQVTPEYLQLVKERWVETGWVKMNGKIAVKNGQGANRYLQAIKTVMKWAQKRYKLTPLDWDEPTPFVVPNKGRRIEWYEPNDMSLLWGACQRESYADAQISSETVLQLGYGVGLRPGEMRHLWVENIDFERDLIQITGKEWTDEEGVHHIWRPKAEDSKAAGADRSIRMGADLKAYLLKLVPTLKSKWVVAQWNGKPFTKDGLSQKWRRLNTEAGTKVHGCPYTLRHTYAVEFMRAGGNIYDLQHNMGHSSVTTTEIYAKFAPKKHETVTLPPIRAISGSGPVPPKPPIQALGMGS